jgi:hypothetical protein
MISGVALLFAIINSYLSFTMRKRTQ